MNASAKAAKQPGYENVTPLIAYIVENIEAIREGAGVFNGQRITMDTELVRFHTCYSMLVVFMSRSSPYYLKDSPEASKAASIAIVASSLLGWWSIHGLIYTPITLAKNILRSDKISIRQLIEAAETPPKKIHPALRVLAVVCLLFIFGFFIWVAMNSSGGTTP
jgi:hypothetical protein